LQWLSPRPNESLPETSAVKLPMNSHCLASETITMLDYSYCSIANGIASALKATPIIPRIHHWSQNSKEISNLKSRFAFLQKKNKNSLLIFSFGFSYISHSVWFLLLFYIIWIHFLDVILINE
jgi:hypothetical protein